MSSLIQRIVSPSLLINHSKCKSCNVNRQFRTETYSAAQSRRDVDAFKRSRTSPSSSTSSTYQLTLLRKQLNEQPERVIRLLDLAENDNLSNDEYIRLGRRGSLCVTREVKLFINYYLKFIIIDFSCREQREQVKECGIILRPMNLETCWTWSNK